MTSRPKATLSPAGRSPPTSSPRRANAPVTMHWYSGDQRIPRPKDLEPGRNPVETGAVVLGDTGTIMYGSHGAGGVRIIPEAKMQGYKLPRKQSPGLRRLPSPGLAAGHSQGRQVRLRFLLRRAADGNRLVGRHCDQNGRQEARVGPPGHAIHQLP